MVRCGRRGGPSDAAGVTETFGVVFVFPAWDLPSLRDLGKAAGEIASALANGTAMSDIEGASIFDGGEKGIAINAILMEPTPLTRDNLSVAIDGGHISKAQACAGAINGVDGC